MSFWRDSWPGVPVGLIVAMVVALPSIVIANWIPGSLGFVMRFLATLVAIQAGGLVAAKIMIRTRKRRWLRTSPEVRLHAYQITPSDVIAIRKASGDTRVRADSIVKLPSGRVISGAELRKYTIAESVRWM